MTLQYLVKYVGYDVFDLVCLNKSDLMHVFLLSAYKTPHRLKLEGKFVI